MLSLSDHVTLSADRKRLLVHVDVTCDPVYQSGEAIVLAMVSPRDGTSTRTGEYYRVECTGARQGVSVVVFKNDGWGPGPLPLVSVRFGGTFRTAGPDNVQQRETRTFATIETRSAQASAAPPATPARRHTTLRTPFELDLQRQVELRREDTVALLRWTVRCDPAYGTPYPALAQVQATDTFGEESRPVPACTGAPQALTSSVRNLTPPAGTQPWTHGFFSVCLTFSAATPPADGSRETISVQECSDLEA